MYRLTLIWLAACVTPAPSITCTASLTATNGAYQIAADLACDRTSLVHVDLGIDDDTGPLGSIRVAARCPGSVAAEISTRASDGRAYATVGVYDADGADVCWGYLP